jgi:hypothetical protein
MPFSAAIFRLTGRPFFVLIRDVNKRFRIDQTIAFGGVKVDEREIQET